jgi:hypothetical protein
MEILFSIRSVVQSPVAALLDYVATQPHGEAHGKVDAPGGTASLTVPDDSWVVSISIEPQSYHADVVRAQKMGDGSWQVDNPACQINAVGGRIAITATVGRLRTAPTVHVPDEQIARLASDPPGVLIAKDNRGFIYHSYFAEGFPSFTRLEHPILDPKTAKNASEWQRLRAKAGEIKAPKQTGAFFHLEYGGPQAGTGNAARLLLSLYLPDPGPRSTLDIITFFSPTTAIDKFPHDAFPFRGKYPYGMHPKTNQPYPRHAQGYLFNGTYLVYQLLAAKCKAALVFPVAAFGDWSVFQTRAGLHRLLLECSLFLHREMLTTTYARARPAWPETTHAGGTVRRATAMGAGAGASVFAHYNDMPAIGRVAVAGYSSGCIPLYHLLAGDVELPKNYAPAHWGVSSGQGDFNKHFKELWDIDGAHRPYHGYAKFETALWRWYSTGGKRFRLYHSGDTGGDHDYLAGKELSSLKKPDNLTNRVTVTDKSGTHTAVERHAADRHWSTVAFDNGYLSSEVKGSSLPHWMLNDTHHFMPKICFGHAALLFAASGS